MDRDLVIELAARVKSLRDELAKAEAELDAQLSGGRRARRDAAPVDQPRLREMMLVPPAPITDAESAARASGAGSVEGGIPERVLRALEGGPTGQRWTPMAVARAIGERNVNNVRNTLGRLNDLGRVRRLARGVYAAMPVEPAPRDQLSLSESESKEERPGLSRAV